MALNEGIVRVQFTGGLDTKSDPKTVVSTRLLVAENVVFSRAGSLRKRNGHAALSTDAPGATDVVGLPPDTMPAAIALGNRDDELLAFTGSRCYSRQSGEDQWSDAGAVYSAVGTDRPLVRTGTQQLQPDHATLDGVTVAAWEDSNGGVWWSVIDEVSGRVFRAPTQADALGQSPRCVPCGTNLHVYYAVPTQQRIMVIVVRPESPAAGVNPAILVDDLDPTNPAFDALPLTARVNTPAAIVWTQSSTANLRVGYVDGSGVVGTALTGWPSPTTYPANRGAATPLGITYWNQDGGEDDIIVVAYVDATSMGAVIFFTFGVPGTSPVFSNIEQVYSATSVQRLTVQLVSTNSDAVAWIAFEEAAAAPSNRFVAVTSAGLFDGPTGSVDLIRSVGLVGKTFIVGTDIFAVFAHDTTFFNSYFTIRLNNIGGDGILTIGRHAPGSAAGAPLRRHLSSTHLVADVAAVALPFRERLASENDDKFRETGIQLFKLDFDSTSSHQTAQLGRGLYMGGACASHYDGRAWTELGFNVGPELIVTANGAGGSLTPSTTYEYRAWYERTDFQGEVHRGPTSAGTLVTMGGADTQVTLTLPTYRITKQTGVRIGVARSFAAKTGDTAQMFRVTSLDPTAAGPNGYVASSTTVNTVTFVDRMSDAVLGTQEELYTDGGILSNDPTPLGAIIARSKSRLFATDPSDGTTIRYSQPIDDGFGVEWPPDLTQKVDPFGGDVTALTSQDDRVVVFKRNAIFVFNGDGPAPNGDTSTGGFTLPQLVTSDVGCVEPNSIVLIPSGHMFQSPKGIYLLARDGSVSYVGAPVEAFNGQRITSATLLPDRTEVLFLTDAGSSLRYNYFFDRWSTATNHEGLDAAVVGNQYYYLRTAGLVYRETPGVFADAGLRIRFRIETAWLHMQEYLQGFSRFWYLHILGTWSSPHQLGVQYQTDYQIGWSDSFWLDGTGATDPTGWITGPNAEVIGLQPITGTSYGDGQYGDGPYGGTAPTVYQWRIGLNEKGESIQFRFEDYQSEGMLGPSFEITELVINGGVKGAVPKPFTASRSL